MKYAKLINAKEAGIGVEALCISKHGLGMTTRYVSFKRPERTAIEQVGRSLLFKKFAGSWVFKSEGTTTIVTFTYAYELNFPFVLLKSFIHSVLISNVRHRLKDLKACLEDV